MGTVLKTTLQTESIDKDSSSSDEENTGLHSTPVANPMPTGKPPRPPQKSKSKSLAHISPVIQAKIKELEQSKSSNPKEEMNLLSKILVHLLCSCKTVAAAQELKGIIKQFKEVAKVAMEEGDDTLELLRSNSRASSRSSVRRKARSRTASGNSNISGNSETDSMNTLTPGDSKSSGTDDDESKLNKIRFTSNLVGKQDVESCVSYTLTLPLNKAEENNETVEQEEAEHYDEEDEEWEWEYEDELDASTPTKQGSSGSSRNLTPSDASSGSTRKLLTEMEMGAYNSSSTSHSDHGNSQTTPITEEDDFLDDDDQFSGQDRRNRKSAEKTEVSGHLFCHLEETFKVLSDTYKIITTCNSPECDQFTEGSYPKTPDMVTQQNAAVDDGFEGILDGISNQCVQIESEILRSSRQSTATPEGSLSPAPKYINVSRPNSRSGSRVSSRISRPGSRLKPKTPLPDNAGEDEEWGDEDEWEYYYEDEYKEEEQKEPSRPVSRQKLVSRPNSRLSDKPASRPQSRQNEITDQNKTNESRPVSRIVEKVPSRPNSRQMEQEQIRPVSRPNSRIVRPSSKASSRPSSRNTVKGETNEEEGEEGEWDDEWEYYYEEAEDAAGNIVSRPSSRVKSRQGGPSRAQSTQGISKPMGPSRSASRQEDEIVSNQPRAASKQEGQRVLSRQEAQRVPSRQDEQRVPSRQEPIRVPSRQEVPQASSRAASRQESGDRVPSRIRVISRPVSRAKSNLGTNEEQLAEGEWDEGEWEYYYEEDYPEEKPEEPANHIEDKSSTNPAKALDIKNTEANTLQLPIVMNKDSRPNSRNSIVKNKDSRPNSRNSTCSSRPGSRTGSRAASRIKRNQSSLGSVYEEDDAWYYDDDDELARLSPTLTTAPTTRATSPFPNEKGSVDYNPGTGFSGRRISIIDECECEETTPRPQTVISKTPTNRESSMTPKIPGSSQSRPISKQSNAECRTPSFYNSGEVGYLNPMAGVSMALAAEYLGQDAQQLVASLPANFIEENQVGKDRKKKKHRRKETDGDDDHDEEDDKKKRKKKKNKDGKFLPKVGVKELANRLEGELFQDTQVGNKMVISQDEARDVIRESKKKTKNALYLQESSKASTPSRYSPNKEDKRKTVREMVEMMANQIPVPEDPNNQQTDHNNYSSNQQNYNIPSISVSSNASMPPPVPPLPQNYYSSPTPQYPPMQYQPYPVEVRPQYPQQYQQDNPYQQFPPQPPYQQYQQQYHAYQGYPPPPPQQYQQYPPQQYP